MKIVISGGEPNFSLRPTNFFYVQDMVARFLISLVFDVCESEEDAEGIRVLKRVMVPYFLSKSPDRMVSKYASFTLIDLVVELSSSGRTR